jgi:FkbM family methyltransferase
MNFLRKLIYSNFYFQLIVSYIFTFFYFFSNKKKIKIKFKDGHWVHETFLGKYANTHPIRKTEEYLMKELPSFIKYYNIKESDVIFDAGAGIGTEIIFFSKLVGKSGKVYALEANPNVFQLLLKTIKINNLQNVIPINLAVYNISGEKIKFVSDMRYWLSGKINNEKGNVVVKSISFDDLLDYLNIKIINFAKFNIEGAEKYLIDGKQSFIKACDNVCISCHDFLEDKNSHSFFEISAMLKKNNFNLLKGNTDLKIDPIDKQFYIYAQKSVENNVNNNEVKIDNKYKFFEKLLK